MRFNAAKTRIAGVSVKYVLVENDRKNDLSYAMIVVVDTIQFIFMFFPCWCYCVRTSSSADGGFALSCDSTETSQLHTTLPSSFCVALPRCCYASNQYVVQEVCGEHSTFKPGSLS